MKETKNLEQAVREWVADGGSIADLRYGGCQSGAVSGLIYYSDTLAFYEKHKAEIARLLGETCSSTGLGASELFGDKWDKEDPLAAETNNQNLLAWFGFEETAIRLFPEED